MGILAEAGVGGINVMETLGPLMGDAFGQVISMVTSFLPYVVGLAVLGAGVAFIVKIINKGKTAVG